jgi:isopenicillin N synthase-like dioxygenase
MAAAKVPRLDYEKYLRGGAAGRRELVDGFGDALREMGCARVQGHGAVGDDAAALTGVAHGLLAAVEAYFGLAAGALAGRAAPALAAGGARHHRPVDAALLTLIPALPSGLQVRAGGDWQPVAANPGELLVVPGPALAALTGGIVSAAELRGLGEAPAWCLSATAAVTEPLPEFAAAAQQPS